MYKAGYKTLKDIINADPLKLVGSIDHLPRRVAFEIVAAAKVIENPNSIILYQYALKTLSFCFLIFHLTAFIVRKSRNFTRRS